MANILIADDEKEIVRLLRMYIEANDNIVFEANDGQEALRILDKENIDLAIVDIMMPKKNGYEIIKEIRKERYIPILVISAKVELSDRVFGMDLGADDYITKPFEPLEVAAKVRAHLRRMGAQETVEKEQEIIAQEIKMYDDSPSWRVMFGLLEEHLNWVYAIANGCKDSGITKKLDLLLPVRQK